MKVTVSTKQDKTATAQNTVAEIIFDDENAMRALAVQALIVKAQATWRKNGIPDNCALKMSEFAPGTRHATVVDPLTAAKALSPEERAKLIEALKAM